jgi:ABC-type proline/glycine betaine transport system permease subunit
MTSWLLNFPNINLNIAEPIDEFVRYININYGEVFVAAKKMLSIFINGINGALDMIPWWLMILLVVFATKKLMNSYRNGIIYGGLLFMIGACGYWHMMNETLAIVITAVIFSLLIGLPIGIALAAVRGADTIVRPILDAMQTDLCLYDTGSYAAGTRKGAGGSGNSSLCCGACYQADQSRYPPGRSGGC